MCVNEKKKQNKIMLCTPLFGDHACQSVWWNCSAEDKWWSVCVTC